MGFLGSIHHALLYCTNVYALMLFAHFCVCVYTYVCIAYWFISFPNHQKFILPTIFMCFFSFLRSALVIMCFVFTLIYSSIYTCSFLVVFIEKTNVISIYYLFFGCAFSNLFPSCVERCSLFVSLVFLSFEMWVDKIRRKNTVYLNHVQYNLSKIYVTRLVHISRFENDTILSMTVFSIFLEKKKFPSNAFD